MPLVACSRRGGLRRRPMAALSISSARERPSLCAEAGVEKEGGSGHSGDLQCAELACGEVPVGGNGRALPYSRGEVGDMDGREPGGRVDSLRLSACALALKP